MQAIQGYFDGTAIRPLEELSAKPNQRVIITLLDEYLETDTTEAAGKLRGVLSAYADPALAEKEKDAWERSAVDKYGAV